jgi:hypothetical protein
MRPRSIALLLFVIIINIGCLHKKDDNVNTRTLLEQRITGFYSEIDPKLMWNYFSNELKKKHNNSQIEFEIGFKENNYFKQYRNIRFHIKNISIDGNKARVTIGFSGEEIIGGNKIKETLYDYWIIENHNWFFENPNRTE